VGDWRNLTHHELAGRLLEGQVGRAVVGGVAPGEDGGLDERDRRIATELQSLSGALEPPNFELLVFGEDVFAMERVKVFGRVCPSILMDDGFAAWVPLSKS